MKIKLTLSERWGAIVTLAQIKQGKLQELRLVKKTLDALRISEEEKAQYGITIQGSVVQWDENQSKEKKEFTLDKEIEPFLKLRLQNLSEGSLLTSEMIDIAEKLGVE